MSRFTWGLVLVALLGALPYLPVVGHPLVWDAAATIGEDESIRTLSELPRYFVESSLPQADGPTRLHYWRPLPKALLALQYAAFGTSPAGYHLVSLLLASLGVIAGGLLVRATTGREDVALGAALLWAVSPARVEAIAWAYGQSNLLCALSLIVGLLAWHRSRDALALLAFAAALLCRESAVMLPVLLLAWDAAHGRVSARRLARPITLVALWLVVRTQILGALPPVSDVGLVQWSSTAPVVLATALSIGLWPLGHVTFYPLIEPSTPQVVGASLVVCAWIGALVALARRDGATALWLAWPLIWVAPWLNVGRFADFTFTEKAMYLPALGLAVVVALGVSRLPEHRLRTGWLALAGIALLHGTWTASRASHWSDTRTFLEAVIASTPDYAPPLFMLGMEHVQEQDYAAAEPLFVRAAEARPEASARSWVAAGNCRDALGDSVGAEAAWERALEADPSSPGALFNLATNAERRRDLPTALDLYQRFLAAEPSPPPELTDKVRALERYLSRQP